MNTVDYLILGSGHAALTFATLMAQRGQSVMVLEAHEHFGGYGHNFTVGDFTYNAQFHYIGGCGPRGTVTKYLTKLGLEKQILFNQLNPLGYDRVFCEQQEFHIPNGYDALQKNMERVAPEHVSEIAQFIHLLKAFESYIEGRYYRVFSMAKLLKHRNDTLQQVFDACALPKRLQTFVSGQIVDYMLPPRDLSFIVWVALFNSYNQGAYYPKNHFNHYIDTIEQKAKSDGAIFHNNTKVTSFILEGKTVRGVVTEKVDPKTGETRGEQESFFGTHVICNFDPKVAASMIGFEKFSQRVRKRLDYDYSPSSFVLYGALEDYPVDSRYFGDWNLWHCQEDHNAAFDRMYHELDYSKPFFAANIRTLHSTEPGICARKNSHLFEIVTVANYDHWLRLKQQGPKAYNHKKKEVLNHLLDTVEQHYAPNLRDHLVLKMTGSPTTNYRYVLAPKGGCYGVNLTPKNFSFSHKLDYRTSLKNFYFCSAASGYGGFVGTTWTGMDLYQRLSGDWF